MATGLHLASFEQNRARASGDNPRDGGTQMSRRRTSFTDCQLEPELGSMECAKGAELTVNYHHHYFILPPRSQQTHAKRVERGR